MAEERDTGGYSHTIQVAVPPPPPPEAGLIAPTAPAPTQKDQQAFPDWYPEWYKNLLTQKPAASVSRKKEEDPFYSLENLLFAMAPVQPEVTCRIESTIKISGPLYRVSPGHVQVQETESPCYKCFPSGEKISFPEKVTYAAMMDALAGEGRRGLTAWEVMDLLLIGKTISKGSDVPVIFQGLPGLEQKLALKRISTTTAIAHHKDKFRIIPYAPEAATRTSLTPEEYSSLKVPELSRKDYLVNRSQTEDEARKSQLLLLLANGNPARRNLVVDWAFRQAPTRRYLEIYLPEESEHSPPQIRHVSLTGKFGGYSFTANGAPGTPAGIIIGSRQ